MCEISFIKCSIAKFTEVKMILADWLISLHLSLSLLVFTTMSPAAGPALRCQATVELQLGVATSFTQEASPLPRPAFL